MQSKLIKKYDIPDSVRKQYAKYLSLELYTDKLVANSPNKGAITFFFKNFLRVEWTPASLVSQFAQVVFITPENANNFVNYNNINSAVDTNKLLFCSGMFSYTAANDYSKKLYMDIKRAMDEYKSNESFAGSGTTVQAALSPAEELKKFKELLDIGIISQKEFDAKKKQLLGL
ncbi:MAG: SHOCT domain-containing protein [Clostridia bacterium]|nr:SHOCT domain-containing protein [Clostridia bacterium]